jgi:hypothetical protein
LSILLKQKLKKFVNDGLKHLKMKLNKVLNQLKAKLLFK